MQDIDLMKEDMLIEAFKKLNDTMTELVDNIIATIKEILLKLGDKPSFNLYGDKRKYDEKIQRLIDDAKSKIQYDVANQAAPIASEIINLVRQYYPNDDKKVEEYEEVLNAYIDQMAEDAKDEINYLFFPYQKRLLPPTSLFMIFALSLGAVAVNNIKIKYGIENYKALAGDAKREYALNVAEILAPIINDRAVISKNGRNYNADTYMEEFVSIDMLEDANNLFEAVIDDEDSNAYGVIISLHSLPAPDHAPYQGRAYTKEKYNSINDSLKRKFMTCNCRHICRPASYKEIVAHNKSGAVEEAKRQSDKAKQKVKISLYSGKEKELTRYEADQYVKQLFNRASNFDKQASTFSDIDSDRADSYKVRAKRCRNVANLINNEIN